MRPLAHRFLTGALAALLLAVLLTMGLFTQQALAADDLIKLNEDVTVAQGEVYTSVVVMNGDIQVAGRVEGDAFTANGSIVVRDGGYVGGNAVSLTGTVRTEGTGRVVGDQVEVGGGTVDLGAGGSAVPTTVSIDTGWNPAGWIVLMVGAIGLGLFMVLISSGTLHSVGSEVTSRPGRTALIGVLSLIGVPVVMVVLMITIIGIPLALLLLPAVFLMGLYGIFALALVIGQRLLAAFNHKDARDVWAMVVGVVLIGVVSAVPVLGWLVFLIAGLMGFGATIGRLWDYAQGRRGPRPAPVGELPGPYPAGPYPPADYPGGQYPGAPYPAGPYEVAPYAPAAPAAAPAYPPAPAAPPAVDPDYPQRHGYPAAPPYEAPYQQPYPPQEAYPAQQAHPAEQPYIAGEVPAVAPAVEAAPPSVEPAPAAPDETAEGAASDAAEPPGSDQGGPRFSI